MIPRRAFFHFAGLAALAGSMLVCKPADAHNPRHGYAEPYPPYGGEYSVSIQSPGGGAFPSFWHGGSLYVAGNFGEAYTVTVQNHTGRRVEAVVSVDGRDVISGEIGDYKKQRGYIVEPYGSVSIDGFRQSLDHVAAFRFSALRDSYSARRGTPQHVGVIGVAVFEEQAPRRDRRYGRPIQPTPPRPYYDREPAAEEGEAHKSSPSSKDARGDRPAAGASEAAPYDDGYYAPSPYPEQMGTAYGETRWSSVREVSFRRKNKRRPDTLLTVYYDSLEGLRARGIPTDPYPYPYPPYPEPEPYPYEPQPFPEREFAPPPPRRY